MSHYIVKTSSAKMPSSCWGIYRRVAVLEIEDGRTDVSTISCHAKGVIRVVEAWEKCHVGKTDRDAYSYALRRAEALAAQLNRKAEQLARRRARYHANKAAKAELAAEQCASAVELAT